MAVNGLGLKSTSHRQKAREAEEWTGRSPLVRQHPLHAEHAEHINFMLELWQVGEMEMVSQYATELVTTGYSPEVVQSILAQGTQGMPGVSAKCEARDAA